MVRRKCTIRHGLSRHSLSRALGAALVFAILVWSVAPFVGHTPQIVDPSAAQQQMVDEHGHGHGDVADLLWLLHGHAHDAIDHDHGHAFVKPVRAVDLAVPASRDAALPPTDLHGATPAPPKLPPRVVTTRFAQRTV